MNVVKIKIEFLYELVNKWDVTEHTPNFRYGIKKCIAT